MCCCLVVPRAWRQNHAPRRGESGIQDPGSRCLSPGTCSKVANFMKLVSARHPSKEVFHCGWHFARDGVARGHSAFAPLPHPRSITSWASAGVAPVRRGRVQPSGRHEQGDEIVEKATAEFGGTDPIVLDCQQTRPLGGGQRRGEGPWGPSGAQREQLEGETGRQA